MTYTIPVRTSGLTTRPLSNILQPMHSTSRFLWVTGLSYVDPSWYPGEPQSVMQQRVNPKSPAWRIYPKPANGVVRPLLGAALPVLPTRFVKLPP